MSNFYSIEVVILSKLCTSKGAEFDNLGNIAEACNGECWATDSGDDEINGHYVKTRHLAYKFDKICDAEKYISSHWVVPFSGKKNVV